MKGNVEGDTGETTDSAVQVEESAISDNSIVSTRFPTLPPLATVAHTRKLRSPSPAPQLRVEDIICYQSKVGCMSMRERDRAEESFEEKRLRDYGYVTVTVTQYWGPARIPRPAWYLAELAGFGSIG